MSTGRSRSLAFAAPLAACLLVAATVSGSAFAQAAGKAPGKAERAAARDAYNAGTASFERGDYVTALDSFVKANALIPSVQAMYWIAQAQDKLGRTQAAIEAYEAITARADFNKLSEDKAAIVNARLAALKVPSAPPGSPAVAPPAEPPPATESTPATEPQPLVSSMPPPPMSEPTSTSGDDDVLPKKNTAELGVMGGMLFVSDSNNLVQAGHARHEFKAPIWQVGVRAAFFPEKIFGVEAEWAHGFGELGPRVDGGTSPESDNVTPPKLDAIRGHLIAQLPTSRLVPFALLGAGLLRSASKQTGSDSDFLLEAGAGLKVMASRLLVPRLDVRLNMTQRKGGGFTDGVAFHPEILLGLGFRLGG